jgi:hypothetical protein
MRILRPFLKELALYMNLIPLFGLYVAVLGEYREEL